MLASSSLAHEHQQASGEKLGTVHFATSCNQAAQKEFNRAVALLHSFQFSRAIEGFNAVLGEDATCAIAYWGIALSDWSNPFAPGAKDKRQLQAGHKSAERGKTASAKTERERAYIAAAGKLYNDYESTPQRARWIAYRDAMANVAAKYPEDHEAQIFYALALAASEDPADKTYADRLKAGAILEKLFEEEPTHPGLAHYIIHTYDVPALADRALVAARRYSEIAPDAPHALHMPSHTFTRTGYWQESIDSNIAAAEAAHGSALANVLRLRDLKSFGVIVAPFDGVVTARTAEVGQLVTAGTTTGKPIFRVAEVDTVRVFVNVPQLYAADIHVGMDAPTTVRERPGRTFDGKVARTANELDVGSRTLLTEVDIPNPDGALIAGMYGRIAFLLTGHDRLLVVPATAVLIDAQGTRAALVRGGAISWQKVGIEKDLGEKVAILTGLAEGDVLVLAPSDRLVEGMRVRAEDAPSTQPLVAETSKVP